VKTVSRVLALFSLAAAEVRAAEESFWPLPAAAARLVSREFRQLDHQRQSLGRELAALPPAPDIEVSDRLGWRVFEYISRPWRGPDWVEIDFGEPVDFDAIALVPAHLVTPDFTGPGYGFPVRFRVEAYGGAASSTVVADFTSRDFPNPGPLPVWLAATGSRARRVRLTIIQPWRNGPLHASALAEIMVLQGSRNLATGRRGVSVRASDSRESPPAWTRDNLVDGQSPLGAPLGARLTDPTLIGHCWHSQIARSAQMAKWVQIDLGRSQLLDEVRLVPARLPQRLHREGYGFPVRFRVEADDDPTFPSPRLLVDHTSAPFVNPGFSPVTVPAGLAARFVRVTATELQHRGDGQYFFALGDLQVYAGDRNLALGAPVSFLDNLEASPNWRAGFLTDGARWEFRLAEWPEWLRGLSRRREVLDQLGALEAKIIPLQHTLARVVAWTSTALVVTAALALLAVYYRLQLRRARESEELRRRIAADLHDDLGSNLASLTLLSELCLQSQDAVPRADLTELHALARETADALRDTTWFIRPGAHTTGHLLDRLRATARRLLVGIEWTFDTPPLEEPIALDVQRHLLLALKESLHNVVRHAAARHVAIRLTVAAGRFTLTVADDGRGMNPAAIVAGQGFASLRHRAGLLGGQAEIHSAPGAGVTVTFTGRLTVTAPHPAPHG
jgi:signal transduction histidine kinase